MQNGNAQNVTESDLRKKFFSGRKCRKYAGKTGFLAFSRDFIISFFLIFCTKMRINNAQNMTESNFWEKFFSGRKCWKYAGNSSFCRICSVFSSYIVVFSHKNIINYNTHYIAWFNCQKNWFLKPELFKNRWNSQFSPEKQYFFNISSCTWYFWTDLEVL